MGRLRFLLHRHAAAALLLLACGLAVRALVPQGWMVQPGRLFALMPCPQAGGVAAAPAAPHAMPAHGDHAMAAMHHGDGDSGKGHHDGRQGGDGVCAFAGLGLAVGPGAAPELLLVALAFALALCFAARTLPPVARAPFLRPPSRGPPAAA